MRRFTQLEVDITRGLLKGVSRGALAGAVLSVATGTAVVTAPGLQIRASAWVR